MKKLFQSLIFFIVAFITTNSLFAQTIDTIYYDEQYKGVPVKDLAKFYLVYYQFGNSNYQDKVKQYNIAGELTGEGTPLSINKFDATKSLWKGRFTGYYPNGKFQYIYNRNSKGEYEGEQTNFYENGIKQATIIYSTPTTASIIVYDSTGTKIREYTTINNEKEGELKEFYPSGNIKTSQFFKGDKANGLCTQYSDGGEEYDVAEFKDGIIINNEARKYTKKGELVSIYDVNTFEVKPIKPKKENCKITYANNKQIQSYYLNNISLSISVSKWDAYGEYYAVWYVIGNLNPQTPLNISANQVKAKFINKSGKIDDCEIISHKQYLAKVIKLQDKSIVKNFKAGQAIAANAAKNSTLSSSFNMQNSKAQYNEKGAIVGGGVDNWGNAVVGAIASTNKSNAKKTVNSFGVARSTSTDGYTQYQIGNIEFEKSKEYQNKLLENRNAISEQYLKNEVINPSTNVNRYFLIKYKKTDRLIVDFTIDGVTYITNWSFEEMMKQQSN